MRSAALSAADAEAFASAPAPKRPVRWHILVFLAPAASIYTVVMLLPLVESLWLSFFTTGADRSVVFTGFGNYARLLLDPIWARFFWNALRNNLIFFAINMAVQNPIGILLAALLSLPKLRGRGFYRTAFFLPTMLSFVIVGFVWRLLLSPTWGVAKSFLSFFGLGAWFEPWLGQSSTALITLSLISVWQFVGIPMMLVHAALLIIPDELIEAAESEGIVGFAQFFKVKLPLIWPSIGIVSMLTFVGNFNAFDLVFISQGSNAGPDYSTDLLGTLLYRSYFGAGTQIGDPYMGATVAGVMFAIIFGGVALYLITIQRRIAYYSF
jgi:raffinose/stachyose/melibiose transport system permease protein